MTDFDRILQIFFGFGIARDSTGRLTRMALRALDDNHTDVLISRNIGFSKLLLIKDHYYFFRLFPFAKFHTYHHKKADFFFVPFPLLQFL